MAVASNVSSTHHMDYEPLNLKDADLCGVYFLIFFFIYPQQYGKLEESASVSQSLLHRCDVNPVAFPR